MRWLGLVRLSDWCGGRVHQAARPARCRENQGVHAGIWHSNWTKIYHGSWRHELQDQRCEVCSRISSTFSVCVSVCVTAVAYTTLMCAHTHACKRVLDFLWLWTWTRVFNRWRKPTHHSIWRYGHSTCLLLQADQAIPGGLHVACKPSVHRRYTEKLGMLQGSCCWRCPHGRRQWLWRDQHPQVRLSQLLVSHTVEAWSMAVPKYTFVYVHILTHVYTYFDTTEHMHVLSTSCHDICRRFLAICACFGALFWHANTYPHKLKFYTESWAEPCKDSFIFIPRSMKLYKT